MIAGLLLAGGASARMGRPKALLALGDRPLIVDQLARLRAAGCAPIACVLGAHADEIAPALGLQGMPPARESRHTIGELDVLFARNPEWTRGSFSSLQTGLRALMGPAEDKGPHSAPSAHALAEGLVILPLDVPGVAASVFRSLLAAAREELRSGDPAAAVIPVYEGHGGHPIWLAPRMVSELLSAPAGSRLDERLREKVVRRVEVDDPHVRGNVNTPEEWEAFLRDEYPDE